MALESQEGQRRELSEGEVGIKSELVGVFGGIEKMRSNLELAISGAEVEPDFANLMFDHTSTWLQDTTSFGYNFLLITGAPRKLITVCDLERNEVDRQGSVIKEKQRYCLEKILELLDLYEETISKAS